MKHKIDLIRVFLFPYNYTELHMKEISLYYDCSLQLLLVTWTVCSAVLAHTLRTPVEFTAFLCLSLSNKHNTFHAVYFRLSSQLWKADCFQATPTPLMSPQYICITLRYQPFSLNIVSSFPFPHNAVQTSLKTYINTNKAHNFLQLASEISGMNCQGHPFNWNRDTVENVHGSSGNEPIIIEPLLSNIQRL
jgi:hypothetical protein